MLCPSCMQFDLCTAESVLSCALEKDCLTIQDGKRVLQTGNLFFTTLYPLRIRLGFSNAPFLETSIIRVHSIQLLLDTRPISSGLGCRLIQAFGLLRLVLYILLLRGLEDLVLLGHSIILVS